MDPLHPDFSISQLHSKNLTDEDVIQINTLLSQLLNTRAHEIKFCRYEIEYILEQDNFCLMIVRENNSQKIVGIASIHCHFKHHTPVKPSYIDDVVVDNNYRGRGLGKNLTLALIEKAKTWQSKIIYLTSSPERAAANKLYANLGFEKQNDLAMYRFIFHREFRERERKFFESKTVDRDYVHIIMTLVRPLKIFINESDLLALHEFCEEKYTAGDILAFALHNRIRQINLLAPASTLGPLFEESYFEKRNTNVYRLTL